MDGEKNSDRELKTFGAPKDPEMGTVEIQIEKGEKLNPTQKENKSWGEWCQETFMEDKYFWLIIVILFIANVGIYRSTFLGQWVGFCLSAYSAIANDSIQTLGTFITSNAGIHVWWKQWLWVATIFIATTVYSWVAFEGDISYGRLGSKGYDKAPESFNYL
jgi:hypothetical protein